MNYFSNKKFIYGTNIHLPPRQARFWARYPTTPPPPPIAMPQGTVYSVEKTLSFICLFSHPLSSFLLNPSLIEPSGGRESRAWFDSFLSLTPRGNYPYVVLHSLFLAVPGWSPKTASERPALSPGDSSIWLYLTPSDFVEGHYLFWERRRKKLFSFKHKECM